MPKFDLVARIDNVPTVRKGELVPVADIVQITRLNVASPYSGDFQIIDGGRLIVGADPDIGNHGILSPAGLFGYNADTVNTAAIYFANVNGHYAGDMHLGNLAENYLRYDQAQGTLGLYSPAGAGVIAYRDGRLQVGNATGAHMLWNPVSEALEIYSGPTTLVTSIDAHGDASFTGNVNATGGRFTGYVAAGVETGPQLQLGVIDGEAAFVMRNRYDVAQLVAKTSTLDNIHVHIGNPKPEAGWLEYDEGTLAVDGTIRARAGEFLGRLSFGPAGEIVIGDPENSQRYGHILPQGIVGYSVSSIGEQYAAAVDAWGNLTVTYGPGQSRTWIAGEGFRGDYRYRHFRWERGPDARVGLFNGETGVAYITADGNFYGSGEIHAANDRVALGEINRGVRISRINASSESEGLTEGKEPEGPDAAEPVTSLLTYVNENNDAIWAIDAWKDTVDLLGGTYDRDVMKIKSNLPVSPSGLALLQFRAASAREGVLDLQAYGNVDGIYGTGGQQVAEIIMYAGRHTSSAQWNHSRIRLDANTYQLIPHGTSPLQGGDSLPDGLLAFADPALAPDYWNPGGGKGLYWRQNGTWWQLAGNSAVFLPVTGAVTGATSQAQAFTNGVIAPLIKPASNSTTAVQVQNASGSSILNVDTTNNRVGIGNTGPGQALDVTGYGKFSSGVIAPILQPASDSTTAVKIANASGTALATFDTTNSKLTLQTTYLGFYSHSAVARPGDYSMSNVTTNRTLNANATTLDEVADVLGTLILDLISLGLLGGGAE